MGKVMNKYLGKYIRVLHIMPAVSKGRVMFCSLITLFLTIAIATGCDMVSHPGQEKPAGQGEPAGLEDPAPENMFSSSTGDIHDYLPDLLAGKAVSGYDLLPCLENFTPATWLELNDTYALDWWNPFWEALRSAAVSNGRSQHDYDEQSLRNYYLGKAVLSADGAYTEGLINILALQWDYDKALFSACLSEHFAAEEADSLRQLLLYSLSYRDDTFGLQIPGAGGALYLDAYPLDFPFGFDLAEQSREGFRAESFGPGAIMESDGLQVTYLNPSEGVYTVTTIRASGKGYSAAGTTMGDTEETLLRQWSDKSLRRLDRISYDDEAWFGSQYDFAYAYTEEEGTKSILFLIKEGTVCGLELIDGLDGVMY
ncbi:MAG: hypothetical protein ACOX7L_03440 [Dethiobacteria bacterium]|jgi:hypothetical protein